MASHSQVRRRFVRGNDEPRLMGVAPSTLQVVYRGEMSSSHEITRFLGRPTDLYGFCVDLFDFWLTSREYSDRRGRVGTLDETPLNR